MEIIGNSKDLKKLQKHFKKMFAGVHSIILSEDEKTILGMMSKEGEELRFVSEISIIDHPRINEWLTAMEKEMRVSLAKYLNVAVKEISVGFCLFVLIDWLLSLACVFESVGLNMTLFRAGEPKQRSTKTNSWYGWTNTRHK